MNTDIDPKYYRKVFPLTKNQEDFLELLKYYYDLYDRMPTVRLLMIAKKYKSTWAITKMYEALRKKGYVKKVNGGYKLI